MSGVLLNSGRGVRSAARSSRMAGRSANRSTQVLFGRSLSFGLFITLALAAGSFAQAATTLLSEDFATPLTTAWIVVDEGNNQGPSDWRVASGELTQNSNIYHDDFSDIVLAKEATYLLYSPGSSWSDYTMDWIQRSEDNDALGIMFRYVDNNNYYRFCVD